MRRFFIEDIPGEGCLISITGKEANHIRNALRMKPGDALTLMDGKGRLFEAVIEGSSHKSVKAKVTKALPAPFPAPIQVHLAQALIKPRSLDLLIQKATELGVSSITPFISERTALKLSAEQVSRKMAHWNEVMKAACKQSGSLNLPALNTPLKFEEMVGNERHGDMFKILLWEAEKETDLKGILRTRAQSSHIEVAVGPEGGFTQREIRLARAAGYHIVSLGSRILRSETASLILIAIMQYEWGDLSLRQLRE